MPGSKKAVLFCAVEGDVGVLKKLFGAFAIGRRKGYPNACPRRELLAIDIIWLV